MWSRTAWCCAQFLALCTYILCTAASSVFRFGGAFAKLRKVTVSFVMSVCPSSWNGSAPTGRFFMNFGIWWFFEKSLEKIKVLLISDRRSGTLHEDLCTFMIHIVHLFLEWEMFQTNLEKFKTHVLCSVNFYVFIIFFSKNSAFCDTICRNIVAPDRTHGSVIRRMRFACWLTRYRHTQNM